MKTRVFTFVRVGKDWLSVDEAERKYGQGFVYRAEEVLELKFTELNRGSNL